MRFDLNGTSYSVSEKGFVPCLTSEIQGETEYLTLTLKSEEEITPQPIELSFMTEVADIFGSFTPAVDQFTGARCSWQAVKAVSRTAFGAPVISLIGIDDSNRLTVALSDCAEPTEITAGVTEEEGLFRIRIRFFTALTSKRSEYKAVIRLDRRKMHFADALSSVTDWWNSFYTPARIPDAAYSPLYSSWYNFHQRLDTKSVLDELKIAKRMGMDTVILDDGWQTEDNSRGYAYCGDWLLATSKIADMRYLSDQIHKIGMKFMIWYSVPYVGVHSKNYERFRGKYLNFDGNSDFYSLDVRFRECREFLVDTYVTAVKNWDLDGLKLDFIDSFYLTEFSSTDYANMDTVSLQAAVDMLLSEITTALKGIKSDFLIEFRQNYTGPVVRKYGNMLRVTDCPAGALYNRVRGINLRLTSGNTAVHSDMIMFIKGDSVENCALQIANAFFLVPQWSVMLREASDKQLKMLEFYTKLWKSYREVICFGHFVPTGFAEHYTAAVAFKDNRELTALYGKNSVTLTRDSGTVVVATAGEIFVQADRCYKYEIKNCMGETVETGTLCGTVKKKVPLCGVLNYEVE